MSICIGSGAGRATDGTAGRGCGTGLSREQAFQALRNANCSLNEAFKTDDIIVDDDLVVHFGVETLEKGSDQWCFIPAARGCGV